MAQDPSTTAEHSAEEPVAPDGDDLAEYLVRASPQARTDYVLSRIEANSEHSCVLPRAGRARLTLDDVRLGAETLLERRERTGGVPAWWDEDEGGAFLAGANFAGASLNRADFSGALLRSADFSQAGMRSAVLRGACVDAANFEAADLIGADLSQARAGEANFREALLEDASFSGGTLRFADLSGALLDSADFSGADFWGARLEGAEMPYAVFEGATLQEAILCGSDLTGADLRNANLKKANLKDARLRGANLQGAELTGADLTGADLTDASLPRVNLSSCGLHHIRLAGAWLESTRFRVDQLGGALGEEAASEFAPALYAYRNLEQNFRSLGNPEAAGWAYLKARRMGKRHEFVSARNNLRQREYWPAFKRFVSFLSDAFVEWLCDYGESLTRVLRTYATVLLAFGVIYGVTGGLTRSALHGTQLHDVPTRRFSDLLTFSFLTMTSGASNIGIRANSHFIYFLASLQYVLGVLLTGLFGYVLGNRIRR